MKEPSEEVKEVERRYEKALDDMEKHYKDVLEQIRAEIADLPIRPEYQQTEHEKGFIDATNRALQILDKYTKGAEE